MTEKDNSEEKNPKKPKKESECFEKCKEHIPVFLLMIILALFMLSCFGLHCIFRPQYPPGYMVTARMPPSDLNGEKGETHSTSLYYCNEPVLQQITSYYETVISLFVMIITILMATSFASVYYITRRQISSTVIEEIERELSSDYFKNMFKVFISHELKKREILEQIENSTYFNDIIKGLQNQINTISITTLGHLQDLEDNIKKIEKTINNKRNSKVKSDGVQKTDNNK